MANNYRLADLLAAELQAMNSQQKSVFRRELSRELPLAVKTAADKAKKAAETAQDKATS